MEYLHIGMGNNATLILLNYGRGRFTPAPVLIQPYPVEFEWLIKDLFHMLMEGAPANPDVADIDKALAELPGVVDVRDL